MRPGQSLAAIRYFTALFRHRPEDPLRHIRAGHILAGFENVTRFDYDNTRYHLPKGGACHSCGATWETFEEKMTDVNIALSLFRDAQR